MGQFFILIDMKTAHGYYRDMTAKFRFLPTPKTEKLMRNRGILFRQTDDGCRWLVADDCGGFLIDDKMECVLQVQDTDFMRVTQLDDYHPQSFYQLRLPDESRKIDVVSALEPTNGPMGVPYFCGISIELSNEMLEKAKQGKPLEYQLLFRLAAYRWEYLFVLRNKHDNESKSIMLENTKGEMLFTLPEKRIDTPYGEIAWRIVSTTPIVCRQYPDCNLLLYDVPTTALSRLLIEKLNSKGQLTEELEKEIQSGEFSRLPADVLPDIFSDKSLKKRTLSRFVSCPRPGQYKTEQRDCIRQVCYI